ncbi:hypothetical protein SHL15_1294 [Streptomyces hygroscopicus subsp. limoneus]|nr:hypothetical protein SHL15_1294 [Streptomyces hygroscopicus subsp. limoneus]
MWSGVSAVPGRPLGGAFTALPRSRRERAARAGRGPRHCTGRRTSWWRPR